MSKYLCLVSLLLAVAIVNSSEYKLLSSKTRYDDVKGQITPCPLPGYKPFGAILFMRHGTNNDPYKHYDNRKTIKDIQDKIIKNIENNQEPAEDSLEIFLEYDPYELKREPGLFPISKQEIQAFALRLKTMFSQLFNTFDDKKHPILIMPDEEDDKTVEISSQILLEALFDKTFSAEMMPKSKPNDLCFMFKIAREVVDPQKDEHQVNHKKNKKAYENSDGMTKMIERFSRKLLLEKNDVSYSVIKAFWEDCRSLRLVTQNNKVGTCPLFQPLDAQLMVEADEIWWRMFVSKKNAFNRQLPCGIGLHVLTFLESDELIAPIYVTYRATYLVIAMILGVLTENEEELTTSHIMPNMANFLAVKYKSENPGKKPRVSFHFNENLTLITLNNGEQCDFCLVADVIGKLKSYLDNNCQELGADPHNPNNETYYSLPAWKK